MSQYNDPGKLEAALKAVVDGLSLALYTGEGSGTVAINTGQDDDELTAPSVACVVVDGEADEVVKGTGLLRSRAVIRVVSSAEDITLAEHRQRAATVFDGFFQSDIVATLAAAVSDFHCYEVKLGTPSAARKDPGRDENQFVFVSELPLDIVWCGSDIA